MSVKYRIVNIKSGQCLQAALSNDDETAYDLDTWVADRKGNNIFINDIVEMDDEKYIVRRGDGYFRLLPQSKRMAWYDEVVLDKHVGKRCVIVNNLWKNKLANKAEE